MKYFLVVMAILLFGCVSAQTEQAETDVIETNVSTPPPVVEKPKLAHFTTLEFAFQYPPDMEVQESKGHFSGIKIINNQPAEMLEVVYLNTVTEYGPNKNRILNENPSKGASDLLREDVLNDSMGYLNGAELGQITTFSIQRDAYSAEVPFKTTLNGTKYAGYALSLFIPERSLHLKLRILATDPARAKQIRDDFVFSFRLE
ncbi:hypothetical protein JXA56_05625 [Candidatus Micrarchaeota archaeon]|nr:hypothetical protein [Candidatus Micrarchaeota archaeon]